MDGQSQMIELKGIVRNRTKLGVEDGQCEDIINMRFRNGAWRPSGDGKFVFVMGATDNSKPYVTASYEQIYVHTNIYRHVLGVRDSTLYWFAEIDKDGETFYPLDNTSDRSSWPADYQSLPTAPVALTTVTGDVWITQTGHLLTIIDEDKSFEYLVFKTGDQVYIKPITDNVVDNNKRELYPFGQIHFNYHTPKPELLFEERTTDLHTGQDSRVYKDADFVTKHHPYLCLKQLPGSSGTLEEFRTIIKGTFGEIEENNVFSRPLLACAAIKLYDGTYAYASNPVLIYPRQQSSAKRLYEDLENGNVVFKKLEDSSRYTERASHYPTSGGVTQDQEGIVRILNLVGTTPSTYVGQFSSRTLSHPTAHVGGYQLPTIDITDLDTDVLPSLFQCLQSLGGAVSYIALLGYDLVMSISDYSILEKNKDLFQSLCVFITPEVQQYDLDNDYAYTYPMHLTRPTEDIIYDLMHSPMFLLKEYKISELSMLKENQKIDLSSKEDENILKNIVEQEQLPIEATSRTTYLPKVSYMYNGRLHIANYKSYPFFGYPLDIFHLHNHSVKVEDGKWFPNDTTQKVIRNLTGNSDDILQFPRVQKTITNIPDLVSARAPYFLVKVHIDAEQGEQVVCRYIPAYNPSTPEEGRADFIEDLNPLLTFPDVRANKMEIFYISYYQSSDYSPTQGVVIKAGYHLKKGEFELKPHPYLNMAYYIEPGLNPIKLNSFAIYPDAVMVEGSLTQPGMTKEEVLALTNMQNAEEYFPNGLKVSKTDNPMYFPVEYTYQVGSAEILALMSNTIAVGTGQTGAAPLYVFCKDGVYALFVDASGEMVYTNARVIARDVCNNARSVTPTDAGVVFTTDRGLMMIAGEQVEEIGEPAEGDVLRYTDDAEATGVFTPRNIVKRILNVVAELPLSLNDGVDFLTYIKGCIVNYNHNLRELIISNPNYGYSYILDAGNNWKRYSNSAEQYVNNFPTSYRVRTGRWYKVDQEEAHLDEADNKVFILSNIIKLGTIGFKQAYRFVSRGYFDTKLRPAASGVINGREVYFASAHITTLDIGDTLDITYIHNGTDFDAWCYNSGFWNSMRDTRIYDKKTLRDITDEYTGMTYYGTEVTITRCTMPMRFGCYVFGSHDGRQWELLGGNERAGTFTDLGCTVHRTDVKFYRFAIAGQLLAKSRIDFLEMSAAGTRLGGKIR